MGVEFVHGRWVSASASAVKAPATSPASASSATSEGAGGSDAWKLSTASTVNLPAASDAAFPDDLDDIPDWDGRLAAWEAAAGDGEGPDERPAADSATASAPLSVAARATPADEPSQPSAVLEPPPAESSAAAEAASTSLPCSPLLAAKMAQFPDDWSVRELEELEEEEEKEEDGEEEVGEEGEDADGDRPQRTAASASLCTPSTAAVAVSGRLHDRLFRVSLGGAEQFPADIDALEEDDNDQADQAAVACDGGAFHTTPTDAPPALRGAAVISASPSLPHAASPSTPLSASAIPSASLAATAPSSRVLNEFALSPSLLAAFRAMEAEHRPCASVAALDGGGAALTRSLQLTWLIEQAERLQAAAARTQERTTAAQSTPAAPRSARHPSASTAVAALTLGRKRDGRTAPVH